MRKESLEGGTGFLFLPLELLRQSMILLLSEEIVLHNFKKNYSLGLHQRVIS